MPFQCIHPEVRDCQLFFDLKAGLVQVRADRFRMKIKVQLRKFHRFGCVRAPGLLSQEVAQHGLQVALVGKLKDEGSPGCHHVGHLVQR